MSILVEKYDYPALSRKEVDGERRYVGADSKPVPSVTTILDKTADKTALIEWRKRVGDAEAARISRESAGLGTKVHDAVEKFIKGQDWAITGNNMINVMASKMAHVMIENLEPVDEVWGSEVGLIAEGIYAGTTDAVGVYNGVPSIIDFKTAKKIKKREWIEDYFLQGAAYALAHNEMFQTSIQQVAILMIDRDARFKSFVIRDDEFVKYAMMWEQRILEYYRRHR
jgi:ATP-dependent exoDNAse (exonuclease V) beta subunit